MRTFSSALADRLGTYVKLQRALGYQFEHQAVHLQAFDEYLVQRGHTEPVTQEIVIAFATDGPSSSMDRRARRYHVVRRFCEYLATYDPHSPVLDPPEVWQAVKNEPALFLWWRSCNTAQGEFLGVHPMAATEGERREIACRGEQQFLV